MKQLKQSGSEAKWYLLPDPTPYYKHKVSQQSRLITCSAIFMNSLAVVHCVQLDNFYCALETKLRGTVVDRLIDMLPGSYGG